MPSGQDRIVPIFLATLAVQQKSQVIRFQSASEMLETFGMHKGGREYRRLVEAFERILGATMFFGTDAVKAGAKVIHRSRFNFLREARIWYNRDESQPPHSVSFENVIVLSDEFLSGDHISPDSDRPRCRPRVVLGAGNPRSLHVAFVPVPFGEGRGGSSDFWKPRPRRTTRQCGIQQTSSVPPEAGRIA